MNIYLLKKSESKTYIKSAMKTQSLSPFGISSRNFPTLFLNKPGSWSTITFKLILCFLKIVMASLYLHWSSNVFKICKAKALGWITSRFPRGICKTVFVSPGTANTSFEPRSRALKNQEIINVWMSLSMIKFRFSEKATKIGKKISHLFWHNWVNVKTSVRFFQILWPSHNVLTLKVLIKI